MPSTVRGADPGASGADPSGNAFGAVGADPGASGADPSGNAFGAVGIPRAPVVEVALLVACVGAAALVVAVLSGGPAGLRALEMLPVDVGAVAVALLVTAAWTGRSRRARLVAAAVALYPAVPLLLRGAGLDPVQPFWLLAASVAALGAVALLAQAVRPAAPRHDRAPHVLVAVVAVAVVAIGVTRLVAPAAAPPSWLVTASGMMAWSGAGAMSLLLIVAGVQRDRPVLRRVGLAFATLTAAHAIALVTGAARGAAAQVLELGAMVMLVGTGVAALTATIRTVRSRLAEADAVLATAADREEKLRAAVAALPGAAGAELQRMLDGERVPSRCPPHRRGAAVGPLLRDLAVVHRSSGLAVDLDVEPDLRVGMDHWALGQAVTNLLVNCERHAPGAHVWLRARRNGGRALVEVVDDGPGLPAGAAPEVLRQGTHGLAVTAEIVDRYGGTFTLTSADGGCVATLDLPVQRGAAAEREPARSA